MGYYSPKNAVWRALYWKLYTANPRNKERLRARARRYYHRHKREKWFREYLKARDRQRRKNPTPAFTAKVKRAKQKQKLRKRLNDICSNEALKGAAPQWRTVRRQLAELRIIANFHNGHGRWPSRAERFELLKTLRAICPR